MTDNAHLKKLKEHALKQSLSRKGSCADNVIVERFFGTLKSEYFYLSEFSSVTALSKAAGEYIHYYNERISLKLKA